MFENSFTEQLKSSQSILLAGMGGGYDIFAGLPLYWELIHQGSQPAGRRVHLANLSFARKLPEKAPHARKWGDVCHEIRFAEYAQRQEADQFAEALGFPENYFPEFHLSRYFFEHKQQDVPVYTFDLENCTLATLSQSYQRLTAQLNVDTLVLVDAGVDSVLRGDEQAVGTYGEDLLSILAVRNVASVPRRFLMCLGLSTEANISEHDFLENWAQLQQQGGYLGCVGLNNTMPAVQFYQDAVLKSVPANTGINRLIMTALQTPGGRIHPLMTLCWFFDLAAVCQRHLFLEELAASTTLHDLRLRFENLRRARGIINEQGEYAGERALRYMF